MKQNKQKEINCKISDSQAFSPLDGKTKVLSQTERRFGIGVFVHIFSIVSLLFLLLFLTIKSNAQDVVSIRAPQPDAPYWISIVDSELMQSYVEKIKSETSIKSYNFLIFNAKYYDSTRVQDTVNQILNKYRNWFDLHHIYLVVVGNESLFSQFQSKGKMIFARKAWIKTELTSQKFKNVEIIEWETFRISELNSEFKKHYTWEINIANIERNHRDEALEAKFKKVPHIWFGLFQKFNFTSKEGSSSYLSPMIYSYGLAFNYTRRNKMLWGIGINTSINLPSQGAIQEEVQNQLQSKILSGETTDDSIAINFTIKGNIYAALYLEGKRLIKLGPRTQGWFGAGLNMGILISIYSEIERKIKFDASSFLSGGVPPSGGTPPAGLGGNVDLGQNGGLTADGLGTFLLFNPYITIGAQYDLSPKIKIYVNMIQETSMLPSIAATSRNNDKGESPPQIGKATFTTIQTGFLLNFRKKSKELYRYMH